MSAPSDVAGFAGSAVRLVLEVLDLRRPPHHLDRILAPAPLDLIRALARGAASGHRPAAAHPRRIHLQPTGTGAVELFGSYLRGDRTFAIAARIEPAPPAGHSGGRGGWVVTAIQVG